jgi:ribosome-binding ATPase
MASTSSSTAAASSSPTCSLDTRLLLGCVGKPSAGKSSLLNACTDANAKMGDYPFTTIEPNTGVAYYTLPCPCAHYCRAAATGKQDGPQHSAQEQEQALDKHDDDPPRKRRSHCTPRYGRCEGGVRHVPIKLLDVAGLVPGASEGKGLGNKFLNDLRAADVLLHVIDVSGTTDEQGRKTEGYDPSRDVEWLRDEVIEWVFGNMWENWPNIVRRHVASKATAATTLQRCWSGYGLKPTVTQRILNAAGVREPSGLASWGETDVRQLLRCVFLVVVYAFRCVYVCLCVCACLLVCMYAFSLSLSVYMCVCACVYV